MDGSDLNEGTEECADVAASDCDEHQFPVTSVESNRELKRKAAYSSEAPATSSSVSHEKRQKTSSSGRSKPKQPWTNEEKHAIFTFLGNYIREGTVPGMDACMQAINDSGGVLTRDWRQMKNAVKNV